MASAGTDILSSRVEAFADALRAQSQAIGLLLTNQKLEIEMLAQVLEAVTRKPGADEDPLSALLAKLVQASVEQGKKLDLIIGRLPGGR